MKPASVLIVTNSFRADGAQRQLLEILQNSELQYSILPIVSGGELMQSFRKCHNVDIVNFFQIGKLVKILFSKKLVICGWMYHANIVACLLSVICRRKLVMSIHHDFISLASKSLKFRVSFFANKICSKYASSVHYPSNKSRDRHIVEGFSHCNSVVIPNALSSRFLGKNAKTLQDTVRMKRGFKLLFIGRNHPDKGIDFLYKVINSVILISPNIDITVLGAGYNRSSQRLLDPISQKHVSFIGHSEISCDFLKRFDLLLVTSPAEAFSLCLLEAAACGLRFVSTDVGVAKELSDRNFGWLAEREVGNFSDQIMSAISSICMPGVDLCNEKIGWIRSEYCAAKIAVRFDELFRSQGAS